MRKKSIFISDLTHTEQGIMAATFPLGASCVFSYAKKELGNEFNFRLFKFPSYLNDALCEESPAMLCFSNFEWNLELSYKFASLAKQRDPSVITVLGGPNFPIDINEKVEFLQKRPAIDFVIELEGELGLVDLVKKLSEYNFNALTLKKNDKKIINTCYLNGDHLISGPISRINNINVIPSPYLTGAMDEFFAHSLVPMIETTRGCPFSCAFCADGQASKNKIHRYDSQKTKEELNYIAKRVKNMSELMMADLNFGMYKQDVVTAKMISDIQQTFNYPKTVDVAGGKNMPKRIIEVASIIKGWHLGAAIQSTDPDVLKAINRDNISSSAYKQLIDFGNNQNVAKTYSDVILGLPSDTKEKHFESIRFAVDNNISSIRMHQAILLIGTEMASKETRKKYGFKTRFRTVPGAVGYYEILGKKHPVAEMQEIIIGSNTLSEKDYLDCRILNLLVLTFFNNSQFEEVFALLKSIGVSTLDCIIYMKDHPELYSSSVKEIIKDFISETTEDLYNSLGVAQQKVLSSEIIDKYIRGELGYNELIENRERLISKFDDSRDLIFKSAKGTLKQKGLLTKEIEKYLIELERFVSIRKKDPWIDVGSVKSMTFSYDFEAISEVKYHINPNSIQQLNTPLRLSFFHDPEQQKYISNQVRLYSAHSEGMGRMLAQSDIRLFFRSFSKSH